MSLPSQTVWWISTILLPPISATGRGSHCTKARQSSGIGLGSVPGVAKRWRMSPGAKIPPQSCGEGMLFSSSSSRASLFGLFQWVVLSSLWLSWRPNLADTMFSSTGITSMGDLQSAWCLLLYCAAAQANFWLRTVLLELSGEFARERDAGVWRCMCQLLHINLATIDDSAKASASLPLSRSELCRQPCWSWFRGAFVGGFDCRFTSRRGGGG